MARLSGLHERTKAFAMAHATAYAVFVEESAQSVAKGVASGSILLFVAATTANYARTESPELLFSYVPAVLVGCTLLAAQCWPSAPRVLKEGTRHLIDAIFATGILGMCHVLRYYQANGLATANVPLLMALLLPNVFPFCRWGAEALVRATCFVGLVFVGALATGVDLSPFSLQIVFGTVVGISVSQYLARQQLYRFFAVEFLSEQVATVVSPHVAAMLKEGHAIEDTIPIGVSEAAVLAFDVVGSSAIALDRKAAFDQAVSRALGKCERFVESGALPQGFVIKEMGDGFLMSFGFPYPCQGSSPAERAARFALRFAAVFHEELAGAGFPAAKCGIGIASDEVEGYFNVQTRRYDLRGRGIVLATRYEAHRKAIYRGDPPASVLIISAAAAARLTDGLRNELGLIRWNCVTQGRVRDDHDAAEAYFALLDGQREFEKDKAEGA